MEPAEEHKSIELVVGEPDKTTRIGSDMSRSCETMMIEFLRRSIDMFAWSPSDFKGIDTEVIVHRLNVDPMMRPVKQKKRSFGAERNHIIEEEVNKLLDAGYVSEVQYKDWLANVVVVPTASGKWRATYQRLVNRMFKDQIDAIMEVYVDDMLVKSRKEDDHLKDLRQVFEIMRVYGMKLNPNKCTLGVRGGKFLGYMVSERGIEVNPEKIEAIKRLQSPRTLKEVQKLMGIRKSETLSSDPTPIANPKQGEVLFLYQAISEEAVSSVLVREQEKTQNPVYYAQEKKEGWLLHVDGSSNTNNGGAGILLQGPNEVKIEVAARLSFTTNNNKVEYEALILGLQLAYEAGARELNVCTDSQLQIPRNENERAYPLSKFGAMVVGIRSRKVTIMIKEHPAIDEAKEVQVVEEWRLWKNDLVKYLKEATLPEDPIQIKRIKFKATIFTLVEDELYKRTIDGPLLKCLDEERA
ncbi:UNVERIFIED_CONTAM: Retrovirus-related Pol polyprotein from transposon gypsy [Sesamum latifolium]|uniref:Retrovirus-related Pol polyprotein from transposon gypsy n=1 Tax=Sesamum latifolium TaxID=2727402 RepID=A0AAW2UIL2_9LAMI